MTDMDNYPFNNAVSMAHMLLLPYVPQAGVLIDMTCGNGHDTAFLASLMNKDAMLYAFDIQACAIKATQNILAKQNICTEHIIFCQGSHDDLVSHVDRPIDIVLFNLGYLPSGDHEIHTKSEITIKAIKICLNKIAKNGIIMIAAYPGTDSGAREEQAVCKFLEQLPQKEFHSSSWRPVNQIHYPPLLYIVQKRG